MKFSLEYRKINIIMKYRQINVTKESLICRKNKLTIFEVFLKI